MNSAAKLRTRGIAVIGATALIATAFGPAAMAWDAQPSGTGTTLSDPGVASIGLIDLDRKVKGTQGATSVQRDVNNQAIGDVRFVFPSTWTASDKIEFTLESGTGDATWAQLPTVNIDEKPYDKTTHIATTSPVGGADGSVEAGEEKLYDGTGTPVKPEFKTSISGGMLTVEFTNSSSSNAKDAKFIGAINGGKVNVPKNATQDVSLKMDFGSGSGNVPLTDTVTYVAALSGGTLAVDNGAVVRDGTPQYVGPITVNAAAANSGKVEIELDGATFENIPSSVKAYDKDGKEISSGLTFARTTNNTKLEATYAASAPAVVRLVLSGVIVKSEDDSITYKLNSDGGAVVSTTRTNAGYLGDDTVDSYSQTDIIAPTAGGQITFRNAAASSNRLGGVDRYDTAARVAASQMGGTVNTPKGESDTVVIASGENYADALSAGYLTATQKATLVLTQKGQLSQATESYLRTYGAKKVYIIGGNAAISGNVEEKLRSLPAYDVQASGSSSSTVTEETTYTAKYGHTSTTNSGAATATLSESSFANLSSQPTVGRTGILTVGRDITTGPGAPSLSVSGSDTNWSTTATVDGSPTFASGKEAFTAKLKYAGQDVTVSVPVTTLGTDGDQVITFTVQSFTTQKKTTPNTPATGADKTVTGDNRKVVATGGNLQVIRLAGENRFVTNRNVNEYALRNAPSTVGTTNPEYGKAAKRTAILANGLTPWDALAAGPLVGSYDSASNKPKPIILTMGGSLEGQAKGQLGSLSIQHAILVGGNSVLPEGLGKELADGFSVSSARLAGDNRWATGKAVGDFLLKSNVGSTRNVNPGFGFGENNPYLVNGGVVNGIPNANKWADALAIGPVAAHASRVVTLTDSAKLPEATEAFYKDQATELNAVIPVGGPDVVSNAVVDAANKIALSK